MGKDALSAHAFIAVEMTQFQPIVGVLDILAVPQSWVPTVRTVLNIAEIPQVQFLGVVIYVPVGVQRLVFDTTRFQGRGYSW